MTRARPNRLRKSRRAAALLNVLQESAPECLLNVPHFLPHDCVFLHTFFFLPPAAARSVQRRRCSVGSAAEEIFSCGSRSGSPSLTSTAQDELLHPCRAFCVCECGLCCQLSRAGGNPLCPLLRNKFLTSSPTDRPYVADARKSSSVM